MQPTLLILVLAAPALGAVCPFAGLRDAGLLGRDDAAKIDAVRRDAGHGEHHLSGNAHQERQLGSLGGLLGGTLGQLGAIYGGGLVGGVLQPLSGPLAGLGVPVPQPYGLAQIPDATHPFQAPGPTDVRGVCPGLNTLANHGYISRTGITTFAESANACQTAYGFDYSISIFLATIGLLAGGDLPTGKFSIGGADARVPNTFPGSTGYAPGIDRHGTCEVDASITREDAYFGNNANFIFQRWNEYVAIANQNGGNFNMATQAQDGAFRYNISRATNPQFTYDAFNFAVAAAARNFVTNGFANGTTPGVSDINNVGPFFLNESFPLRWYRRGVPYTLPNGIADAVLQRSMHPETMQLGANQGVGNFIPFTTQVSSMTGAQLGCFLLENLLSATPGQLAPIVVNNLATYKAFLAGVVAPFMFNDGYFNCGFMSFAQPGQNAGFVSTSGTGSASSGSPVNGAYPGIGYIQPGSQPS